MGPFARWNRADTICHTRSMPLRGKSLPELIESAVAGYFQIAKKLIWLGGKKLLKPLHRETPPLLESPFVREADFGHVESHQLESVKTRASDRRAQP